MTGAAGDAFQPARDAGKTAEVEIALRGDVG